MRDVGAAVVLIRMFADVLEGVGPVCERDTAPRTDSVVLDIVPPTTMLVSPVPMRVPEPTSRMEEADSPPAKWKLVVPAREKALAIKERRVLAPFTEIVAAPDEAQTLPETIDTRRSDADPTEPSTTLEDACRVLDVETIVSNETEPNRNVSVRLEIEEEETVS